MAKVRKFFNNILNPNALRVLGLRRYVRMVMTFLVKLPAIARSGDLRPLDRAMAELVTEFRFRGRTLRFDCAYSDALIMDGSYAFGIVREILIRDCYFRYLPEDVLNGLGNVVDLGANRGLFTTLSAASAERVLSVEADPAFRPVIEHNVRMNGFDHVTVATVFVGSGGALGDLIRGEVDFAGLLDRHGFDKVDLLKMDIEGSEFALFSHPEWLPRVQRICMEVHRAHGRVEQIRSCLEAHRFHLAFADSNLRRVGPMDGYEFLYAWR